MHDPRRSRPPSERDIAALTFIGEGYEVAQYQLHAAIFPNVSAVVVSHFATRAVRNGWIAVERWNRVGINRLRLTSAGRGVVVGAGGDPVALFVPKKPVATKDVAHTLWINDVRVALGTISERFDAVLPAWQLQRRIVPPLIAIPDLLAVRSCGTPFVFACEIDLGGERLRNVFLPKLKALHDLVASWSEGGHGVISVLTSTEQRAASIARIAGSDQVRFTTGTLPNRSGAEGVNILAALVSKTIEAANPST